jgi:hypothetical protein
MIYPLQLLKNENLLKYAKFIYYWNKLERWNICRDKKKIGELAYAELLNTARDTELKFVHIVGTLILAELKKGMSDDAFNSWRSREKKY